MVESYHFGNGISNGQFFVKITFSSDNFKGPVSSKMFFGYFVFIFESSGGRPGHGPLLKDLFELARTLRLKGTITNIVDLYWTNQLKVNLLRTSTDQFISP